MDELFDVLKELNKKHDETNYRLSEIEKEQVLHRAQLQEHMKRSSQNEEALEALKSLVSLHQKELIILGEDRIRQQKMWERVWKVGITVLAAVLVKLFIA